MLLLRCQQRVAGRVARLSPRTPLRASCIYDGLRGVAYAERTMHTSSSCRGWSSGLVGWCVNLDGKAGRHTANGVTAKTRTFASVRCFATTSLRLPPAEGADATSPPEAEAAIPAAEGAAATPLPPPTSADTPPPSPLPAAADTPPPPEAATPPPSPLPAAAADTPSPSPPPPPKSPKPKSPLSAKHQIYISKSEDPYFNLTLEDWLFRTAPPKEPLLLIYRDAPCVVIGRNQNPWTEVNFAALRERKEVPFIRRRSGGGTVFHDLGNTNFSIHLPRASFDRHATAQIILRAVRALGIPDAQVNERNDICVGTDKISSAYKIVNWRAYHHGTMLISTRLDTLGDLLRTNKESMTTKGVASVRSPVCNLQQFSTTITHESFADAVVHEFRKEYGVDKSVCTVNDTEEIRSIEYIRKGMEELPSWEWAYGQTPEFIDMVNHTFAWGDVTAVIRAKHGVILACAFQIDNTHIKGAAIDAITELGRSLEGQRYGFVDGEVGAQLETGPAAEVKTWLWGAML